MENLTLINKELKDRSPSEIIRWALENSTNPILTTNFRPYEAAILHLCGAAVCSQSSYMYAVLSIMRKYWAMTI